jgi:hypothetical protein
MLDGELLLRKMASFCIQQKAATNSGNCKLHRFVLKSLGPWFFWLLSFGRFFLCAEGFKI